MTPDDLDRLEALAAAATPGPWFGPMDGIIASHPERDPDAEWALVVGYSTRETSPANAAYIAALDPATVQQLIAAARLGAAWQAAEAALPEGFRLEVTGLEVGPGVWLARSVPPFLPYEEWKLALDELAGPTPAAALLSLAEALRGRGT